MKRAVDRVFDMDATETQIFEECTAPLLGSVLNGCESPLFAYGATRAKKTVRMLGKRTYPGINSGLYIKINKRGNGSTYDQEIVNSNPLKNRNRITYSKLRRQS